MNKKIFSDLKYHFKYYYADGTCEISNCGASKPEKLYNDFEGLISNEEFEIIDNKKLTTKDILKIAVKTYKGFLKDFYRIEIIDISNNEIIDYIDLKNE